MSGVEPLNGEYVEEVVTHIDKLHTLEDSWNCLASTDDAALMNFQWFFSAARNFYEAGELHVIVVYRLNRIVAIAPLAVTRRDGVPWLELMGASDLHEPTGLLYRDGDALRALCRAITRSRLPVALERIVGGTPVCQQLMRSRSRPGRVISAGTTRSPILEIGTDWESYAQSLSARRRYDYRHCRRVLERQGTIITTLICPTEEDAPALLHKAFQVEMRSWKGTAGSAIECSPRLRGFFLDLGAPLASQGQLMVAFLRLNDEPIAMQIAVLYAKVYWLLKIGHDESWSNASPGFQLMMDVVRLAHERGLRRVEFLGTEEPWLSIWANDSHSYANLFFVPYTFHGLRAAVMIAGRRLICSVQKAALQLRPRIEASRG